METHQQVKIQFRDITIVFHISKDNVCLRNKQVLRNMETKKLFTFLSTSRFEKVEFGSA